MCSLQWEKLVQSCGPSFPGLVPGLFVSGERKRECIHCSLLLAKYVMRGTAISFFHLDFPTIMDCKLNPSVRSYFLSKYFPKATETKQGQQVGQLARATSHSSTTLQTQMFSGARKKCEFFYHYVISITFQFR